MSWSGWPKRSAWTRARSAGRWPNWWRKNWVAKLEPREVLVGLTRAGLTAHDAIVAGAQERNRRLLEQPSQQDLEGLLAQIDRLTETAAQMLAAEKDLS